MGASPWLPHCLAALRADAGALDEIWVVDQGIEATRGLDCDRLLRLEENLGFAGGCNHALAKVDSPYIALVNDDALIDPGWTDALLKPLLAEAQVASVQGLNLNLKEPLRVDGAGVAWNSWWQAIQIGHGDPATSVSAGPVEVFGVSATAAVYRRDSLQRIALSEGAVFDPRLFAYYEDVDVAIRLRAAGYRACRAEATARHAGSTTAGRHPRSKLRWLTRNRLWVVARLLGRDFEEHLPRIRQRELRDLTHDLMALDLGAARARVAGWREGRRGLSAFVHDRPPLAKLEHLLRHTENRS